MYNIEKIRLIKITSTKIIKYENKIRLIKKERINRSNIIIKIKNMWIKNIKSLKKIKKFIIIISFYGSTNTMPIWTLIT